MKITLDPVVLKAVKAAAAPYVPDCRSSHLSEAIAAGLGYRTNIALQTALRAATSVEAPVYDGPAYARLADLGAPRPTVPDFLTRAVAAVRKDALPAPSGTLLVSLRQGNAMLTRHVLFGEDGRAVDLKCENDFAWFLSATLPSTSRAIARVFRGRQRTNGGRPVGYDGADDGGIAVTRGTDPMATRWAKLVSHYVHVERFQSMGHAHRLGMARVLIATAFAADAAATALGMDDVRASDDFLPIRHIVDGAWKAAFVTDEDWALYRALRSGRFSTDAPAGNPCAPAPIVPDPRRGARMPVLPWVGHIHKDISPSGSPLLTALRFGSRSLHVGPDRSATITINGFHMALDEVGAEQIAALVARADARFATNGVPRFAEAGCRFKNGLPEGVTGIGVTRKPISRAQADDCPIGYSITIERAA